MFQSLLRFFGSDQQHGIAPDSVSAKTVEEISAVLAAADRQREAQAVGKRDLEAAYRRAVIRRVNRSE